MVVSRGRFAPLYFPTLVTVAYTGTKALPRIWSKVIHLFGTMSPFLSKRNVPMIPFLTLALNISLTTESTRTVRARNRSEHDLRRLGLVDRIWRHLALDLRVGPEVPDELLARRTEPFERLARVADVHVLGRRAGTEGGGVRSPAVGPDEHDLWPENGVKLLKDIRAAVGPNVVFVGPDGWTPYSATLGAGSAAAGMYISYAGQPLERLGAAGQKFIAQFRKYAHIKGNMPPYSVYQAQAAQVMLKAIAGSNGTRLSVVKQLFKTNVKNGIMGTFHFDRNGDTVPFKWISFDQLRGQTGVPVYAVVSKVGK